MRAERIDLIEDYIINKKNVSLEELCDQFNVSLNTIRRDVNTLTKRGSVKKVYGGVTATSSSSNFMTLTPFSKRSELFQKEKNNICKLAASFVNDNDIIYIDTGTTSQNLIDYIGDRHCIVVTNSLQVAIKGVQYPNLEIFSLPGKLKRDTLSYVGNDAGHYLQKYNISKAFMCSTGVSIKNGLTNATTEEYLVKQAVMENTEEHFLLADHSKFGKFTLMTFANLDDIQHIITDDVPTEEYLTYFKEHNITLDTTN
ncbi:DeoR family myo-inositol catabolism operon transcriptional repressor [Aequitasia blattaphilus]|uniref:DeoR/GlpR family DNA-binding transcription regulator n=1 Tax=Aequitasia blattaphilus TaxID=2949332 RepID=A0ABT1EBU8_9FIRM|nr:DeoR/GlpR family DNA-binding transcription regulator [Aequitasia blattaphilus]MCP1103151.1 DeoR/GlpR family DNA-binding transcription regulator [Aequitasia blattaphilus]MCR8615791.1 DeoR/GlpR family DNA-binding transcription regulator [Aequitasia blattaphilus]